MKDLRVYFDEQDFFNREYEVEFLTADDKKRATLGGLLSYAMDSAGKDFAERGAPHEKLMELGQVFMLSRFKMKLDRMPVVNEITRVKTCSSDIKGPMVYRDFLLYDEQGTVIGTARSAWIIVDPATRRIKRPSSFNAIDIAPRNLPVDCGDPEKIDYDEEGLEWLGDRKIVYSDLDGNGHFYSAKYGNLIMDFVPEEYQNSEIKEFSINYVKEAVKGDLLHIWGKETEDGLLIVGRHEKGDCFTSVIKK